MSLFQKRLSYTPKLPKILQDISQLEIEKGIMPKRTADAEEIDKLFPKTSKQSIMTVKEGKNIIPKPLRVGVVFSGGQAAGGHNVIAGLFDALSKIDPQSSLIGFLGGPTGIVDNKTLLITKELIDQYRNIGGFDLIGSGRGKIELEEHLKASLHTVNSNNLDGIVVIGGDDSNTNAALMAEYFAKNGSKVRVIGVPKTIDGDLQNDYIEISFGFDTACKTYSELIGNIAKDALSAKKYYHFIKLMGRSASHVTLECALQTHPNMILLGEEITKEKKKLKEIVNDIADLICQRAEKNKNYGVILIPEGLIEFIYEMQILIKELNILLSNKNPHFNEFNTIEETSEKILWIHKQLSHESKTCLNLLPKDIQEQLLLDRDPHGNVQVSRIETEKLLMILVEAELNYRKEKNEYKGQFNAINHFFGYEGRSGYPTNFDSDYCYSLGYVAALLVHYGLNSYMACIKNLSKSINKWQVYATPLTAMLDMEMRKGKMKPVIKKGLVKLDGKPYKYYLSQKKKWAFEDDYQYPGPIQFFGDKEICDSSPLFMNL
jgi:pyrophosphate--fructose-6-phosphate 1-phosphotransferase